MLCGLPESAQASVSDPHSLYANPDPDPAFLANVDPDPIPDPISDPNPDQVFQSGKQFHVFTFHQIKPHLNNLYKRHCLKYAFIH
jgi:hypothetical protein